jgi:DNA-directed RNA polymerase subunit RPC12/RpoP
MQLRHNWARIMHTCARCGGKLHRIHRTFLERFDHMAIYKCKDCHEKQVVLRRWRHHFGLEVCCPRCGTARVTKLKQADRIDPMQTGFLNFMERLMGGELYHCRFCRVQFYDRRGTAPAAEPAPESPAEKELARSTERPT